MVLGGAGRLAGSVMTADGSPVRDATVTLTNVHGEVVATTRSGREGGYVITELVAGEYTLAASAPAFRPAALPVSVQFTSDAFSSAQTPPPFPPAVFPLTMLFVRSASKKTLMPPPLMPAALPMTVQPVSVAKAALTPPPAVDDGGPGAVAPHHRAELDIRPDLIASRAVAGRRLLKLLTPVRLFILAGSGPFRRTV